MPDATVSCPNCSTLIPLTAAIAAPIAERIRAEYEAKARQSAQAHAQEKANLQRQLAEQLAAEKEKLQADARQKAEASLGVELADLRAQLAEGKSRLEAADKRELDIRKKQRELEEQKRTLELDMARKLDAQRAELALQTRQSLTDEFRLKEAEKDKLIADLKRQADDLQLKLEQGSQQSQGEVLELQLEHMLRQQFPHDRIEPVPKGVHGGDVIQRVYTPAGLHAGTILWESKRTKTWSADWIEKLKHDQRHAKADLAIILSSALPKDLATFGCYTGIWVTGGPCVQPLASALRTGLIQIAETRRAQEGKAEKMDLIYSYLTGNEFQHRVRAIVDAFTDMRKELDKEKRLMTKNWATREKQIDIVLTNTMGMHGDLTGIMGREIASLDLIEMPTLDAEPPTPLLPQIN